MTEAIEKLIVENRWNPNMDEAPKDGTPIVVRTQDGLYFVAEWDFNGGWRYAEWEEERDSLVLAASTTITRSLVVHKPTHFRPLPDNRLVEVCQILASAISTLYNTATEARNVGDVHLHIDGVISALREALSRANEIATKGE